MSQFSPAVALLSVIFHPLDTISIAIQGEAPSNIMISLFPCLYSSPPEFPHHRKAGRYAIGVPRVLLVETFKKEVFRMPSIIKRQ